MNLKSLLLCSDDKIVRVLRRTLSELEIGVDHCVDSEAALRLLTRDRFESIIVDCAGNGAAEVLRGARTAPCNKRAVAVAILDPEVGLKSAFESGAHFTLYKPVTVERAKSSFRAARALMKKERRRNSRVPLRIDVEMVSTTSGARLKVKTIDIGEGGLAVTLPKRSKPKDRWELSFTLPGAAVPIKVPAEFAWEGSGAQVGLRFVETSREVARQLREWLNRNLEDAETDDPPVRCQLTDLSLYGCYLEIASPFPVSTRITLTMRAAGVELKTEGVVRVMHPEKGMGVEFPQRTQEQRGQVEKFLACLTENPNTLPELLVEPEGLDADITQDLSSSDETLANDPLIALFRTSGGMSADLFHEALSKQRGMAVSAGA